MNHDTHEVEQFNQLADTWWDLKGPCAPLHHLNPERLAFICEHSEIAGKRVIDIGCGGGILTEALANKGANATGLDMADKAIQTAKMHASLNNLKITYLHEPAEKHAEQHAGAYDVVTCMELLEHVPDPEQLISTCFELVRPGGDVFFSTLNRTPKAFAFGIVGAEYLLGLLPKGTHTYERFIRPSELSTAIRTSGGTVNIIEGLHYNPFLKTAKRNHDVSINYLVHAQRRA